MSLFARLPAGANPEGPAFDSSGNLFEVNDGSHTISKISPEGQTMGTFASGIATPILIASWKFFALPWRARGRVIGAFLLLTFSLFLGLGAPAVRGQSALDGFDPNANGTIRAIVLQPDGKILIGGDFTTLQPNGAATATTRNHIARLNPDGTLDTLFDPNANLSVYAIALQADGKILAGGDFVDFGNGTPTIGGKIRNSIARLDPVTGAADAWDPNANSRVNSIVVQPDGKILAGGQFAAQFGTPTIGGATRNRIVRLDPGTGLADSFDPNANSDVRTIAVQADGKILAGGTFTGIGGQIRNRIARLNAATGLADSFNPNSNGILESIALQTDGKILAGGRFFGANSIGGQTRNRIARLNPTTGAADSWDPNASSDVNAITVQSDGKILVGGVFHGANSIGGATTRNRIARLDSATGTPDLFDPNANSTNSIVNAIAVQADGKILVGGGFTTLAPNGGATTTRNNIARLETDGRLDQTLSDLSIGGGGFDPVFAVAVQADGKILIGGSFTSILGVPRNNIARLNTDGTLDVTFDPNANGSVNAIALQPDGEILLGGAFTTLQPNGGLRAMRSDRIARLKPEGTLDPNFNQNADGQVDAIAVQADGKIVIAGHFATLMPLGGAAITRNQIARLDPTGATDPLFDPNANGPVFAIALQPDGEIVVAGTFTTFAPNGGAAVSRNRVARLNPDGTVDPSFNPNVNNFVEATAIQTDGKVLLAGDFTSLSPDGDGGAAFPRNHLARLNPIGTLDRGFDPNANLNADTIGVQGDGRIITGGDFTTFTLPNGLTIMRDHIARLNATTGPPEFFNPNADSKVNAIAAQADGKVLAAGNFTSIGGQPRGHFARLSNDTAALQNLGVTQTLVTWTRGGSSPQLARVTFESSTDNVTYTTLGSGTASGSDWTLTGLNLPTGQNIYIRARGYYRSGLFNGSESIAESVRNAFIPPVLKILSITRPANGHIVLQCLGVPNQVNDLQVSPNLSPGGFMTISPLPAAANATGAFSYDDAGAVGLTNRFYRLAFP